MYSFTTAGPPGVVVGVTVGVRVGVGVIVGVRVMVGVGVIVGVLVGLPGVEVLVGVDVAPPGQTLVGELLLRGLGDPEAKSLALSSLSVQPPSARRAAVVLTNAGAAALPSQQFPLP